MSSLIQVGVLGISGRMGQWIKHLLETEFRDQATLSAAPTRGESFDDLMKVDVVIDFSSPHGTAALVQFFETQSAPKLPALIIGSTGLDSEQSQRLEKLADRTQILVSANFSTGLHAFLAELDTLAPLLNKLGYQPKITETHHEHKKDAPSGTALLIQRRLQALLTREIPISSIREGEVIGDHEVYFEGVSDRICLRHEAKDRSIFARGAIETAIWIVQKAKPMTPRGEILDMRNFLKEKLA